MVLLTRKWLVPLFLRSSPQFRGVPLFSKSPPEVMQAATCEREDVLRLSEEKFLIPEATNDDAYILRVVDEKRTGSSFVLEEDAFVTKEVASKKKERSMASELTSFTLPLLLVWLSSPLLSLADSAFVGAMRTTAELAAMGPGCSVCDSTYLMAYFASVVTTSAVATAKAKGDDDGARAATAAGAFAALVVGLGLTFLLSGLNAGAPILGLVAGGGGETSAALSLEAANYVRHRCLGYAPALISSALQAASLARRDVRPPILAAAAASLVNFLGDALLVPRFGLVGAADATALAQLASFAVVWRATRHKRYFDIVLPPSIIGKNLAVVFATKTKAYFRKVFSEGAPIFLTLLAKTAVCTALALSAAKSAVLSGSLGDAAAHQILMGLYLLFAPVGDALASTVQTFGTATLDSQSRRGITEATRTVVKGALSAAVVLGALDAFLAFLLPTLGPHLFTKDMTVQLSVVACAPFVGLALLLHGASSAMEGAMLAVKDAKRLGLLYAVDAVAFIGIFVALAAKGAPLAHVWAAYVAFQVLRTSQFSLRVKRVIFPKRQVTKNTGEAEVLLPHETKDATTKKKPVGLHSLYAGLLSTPRNFHHLIKQKKQPQTWADQTPQPAF